MTIYTPYINSDMYQQTPDWQKIERYQYCSQMREILTEKSLMSRMKEWFRRENKAA